MGALELALILLAALPLVIGAAVLAAWAVVRLEAGASPPAKDRRPAEAGALAFTADDPDALTATWGRLAFVVKRLLNVLMSVIAVPVAILALPFTAVGGCLVGLTFGLLLLPLNLLWLVLAGLLLGTSWLWKHVPILRLPLAFVGIPGALIAYVFVAWTPSMGDIAAKDAKLTMIWWWPLSLELTSQTAPHLTTASRTPGTAGGQNRPVTEAVPDAPVPPVYPEHPDAPFSWRLATEQELREALAQQPIERCRQHSPLLVSVEEYWGDNDEFGLWYTVVCSQCGKVVTDYGHEALLAGDSPDVADSIDVDSLPQKPWRRPTEQDRADLTESLGSGIIDL